MLSDAQELFATYLVDQRDFSEADIKAECRRLFERQKAIADVLDGKLPPDLLLDMIQEHGIEASEYVGCVQENLNVFEGKML